MLNAAANLEHPVCCLSAVWDASAKTTDAVSSTVNANVSETMSEEEKKEERTQRQLEKYGEIPFSFELAVLTFFFSFSLLPRPELCHPLQRRGPCCLYRFGFDCLPQGTSHHWIRRLNMFPEYSNFVFYCHRLDAALSKRHSKKR